MAENYYKIKETTLTEVADAIRTKTSTTEKVAVTDFANKINSISVGSGGSTEQLISTAKTVTTEVSTMLFSKTEDGSFEEVTLPHSCNAQDCTNTSMHRDDAYYKYYLTLTTEERSNDYILQFEQVIQSATFYLNGIEIGKHTSGYTPYALKLNGLGEGVNTITIKTNNSLNYSQIPLSADFSFPNGIVGKVHLLKAKHLYLDPTVMGYDRFHVNQLNVDYNNNIVDFSITAGITNTSSIDGKVSVEIKVIDAEGNVKSTTSCKTFAAANSTTLFDSGKIRFENAHLWNGQEDPYLYNIEVILKYNGAPIDSNKIPFGFRAFEAPITSKGGLYRLNGKAIKLRGVSLHQDYQDSSSALTDENYQTNYNIIQELHCNWLRLAHYPHNIREIRDYAKLGILAQTEIPWVNNYGSASSQEYRDCIKQYVKDMVNNLYNLTTIAIWGLSNELANNCAPFTAAGNPYTDLFKTDANLIATDGLQVNESYTKLQNECYSIAKSIDYSRPVGLVLASDDRASNITIDWRGKNYYPKWYDKTAGNLYDHGKCTLKAWDKSGAVAGGVTEYGFGMSDVYHDDNWEVDYLSNGNPAEFGTRNGVGGAKHPEEFGFKWHAYYYNQLTHPAAGTPELSFTTLWVLFDFACYARKEGYIKGYNVPDSDVKNAKYLDESKVGINDKGLITRDRLVKKDAYYFYKAVWNPEKMIHINSKSWTERTSNNLSLKIVSNCEKIEIYKNGSLIETKVTTDADANTCGVVYTTTGTTFYNVTDNYKVVGYKKNEDDSYTAVCEDTASFTTLDTENILNIQSFVRSSVTGAKTVAAATNQFITNISSNSEWTIIVPAWVSGSKLSGKGADTITFTVENNTATEDRTGDINIYLGDEVVATINLTQKGYVEVQEPDESAYLKYAAVQDTNQFVNTNYLGTDKTTIKFKIYSLVDALSGELCPFGGRDATGDGDTANSRYVYLGSGGNNITFGNPSTDRKAIFALSSFLNTSNHELVGEINLDKIILNGTDINYANAGTGTGLANVVKPIYLFGRNNNGTLQNSINGKLAIGYFSVYEDGILALDLRPTKDTDGTVCFVDTLTNNYYYVNSGSLTGVEQDGSTAPQESISVNPTSVTVPQAGATGTIAVTASSTYTINNNLDWVSISGSGASLTYTIGANDATTTRNGSITLTINSSTTATVNFTQEAKAETSGGGDSQAGGDSGETGGDSGNEGGSSATGEYTELLSLNSEPADFGSFVDGIDATKPYIDTELLPSVDTKVQLDITMLGASDKPAVVGSATNLMYFGSRGSDAARNRVIIRLGQVDFGSGASATLSSLVAYAGERHIYELSNGTLKVDNTNISGAPTGNWTSNATTVSMYLFGAQDGSKPTSVGVKNGAPCRFYGCKVYNGAELVSDMIPVLDSKGVACVYDKVRNKFLYNKGTIPFTYTAKQ